MKRNYLIILIVNLVLLGLCLFIPCNTLCAGLFSFIGDAFKGITGLGSAIFGGVKSGKERRKAARALEEAKADVDKEKAFNDTLFNRQYYQDFLQRSENQSALKMLRDYLKRENQAITQTAIVSGATPEAVAKQKEITNQAVGDTVSKIAANSSRVKDSVLNSYLNYRNSLNGQLQNITGQKMNLHNQNAIQWSNLMQNGLNALTSSFAGNGQEGSGLGSLLSSLFKK